MITRLMLGALTLFLLCSCQTGGGGGPLVTARNAKIRQEPTGDHFVGRRYWVKGSRTWGWLRRPRQPWDKARLVVMNEWRQTNPDRFPEYSASGGPVNGFDHNYEYKIWGRFTGDEAYDPTTNLVLPEFLLERYQLVDKSPGWLFTPRDRMGNNRLPRTHVMVLASED